tara:strand:+ start:6317 stop:7420 length:1104 start_codon:yes stop_codon:yes gene_type:complete
MSRVTLKSNNSAVLIGASPAFKTFDEAATLFGGVQSVSFSVPLSRETKKQVGSTSYGVDDLVRHTYVDLSIDYLFSPTMINEDYLGLNIRPNFIPDPSPQSQEGGLLSGIDDKSYNFYVYNHPDQGSDAVDYLKGDDKLSPNDGEIVSFGNAYLSNYSISFSIGSLPTVSTSFKCCNMQAENYTGLTDSPAINLAAGNNEGVGKFIGSQTRTIQQGFYGNLFDLDLTEPVTAQPGDITIELENIQVGGQKIDVDNHLINSLSIDIPISRVDLYGLGSDYVRGRKIQYPSRGTINMSSLVSRYETGIISGLLKNESTYEFSLRVKSCKGLTYSDLDFENAKLEKFEYSTTINGDMQYSASFSFALDNK